MSFGLNSYYNDLPAVGSFADAVAAWQDIKPLRGKLASDPRPLGRRESRNAKQVRAELDPITAEPVRIIFRYHRTDVVTWHKDNTCTLEPWPSRSTAVFADSLLPRGVYVQGECYGLSVTLPPESGDTDAVEPSKGRGGRPRCYRLNGQPVTLQVNDDGFAVPLPDAEKPDGTEPVDHVVINVKAANALYKQYHLAEFETFYNAYLATTSYVPRSDDASISPSESSRAEKAETLSVLKDDHRDRWVHLARVVAASIVYGTRYGGDVTPMQLMRWLVRDVHREDCYITTPVPYARSYEKLRRTDNTDPTEL